MVDFVNHQASGLLELSQIHGARLMAVVSHGDEQAELPLLWRICAALTHFGYAVTVLDGTMTENAGNQGLSHMLDQDFWPERTTWDSPAWSVIPAAGGLRELGSGPFQDRPLARLGGLFPSESVVILYAKADAISGLLRDTDIQPLLACGAVKGSLLTSYLALKQLLGSGRLMPMTICLNSGNAVAHGISAAQLASKLVECTRTYLGLEITVKTMKIAEDEEGKTDPDLQRLVLRMLENSLTIASRGVFGSMNGRQSSTGTSVRGH
jgi:hypothetical protein